jgi:hypothetical protein
VTVFFVVMAGRLVKGLLLGVLAGVVVDLYPMVHNSAGPGTWGGMPHALLLVVFTFTLAGWWQFARPAVNWRRWLVLLLGLVLTNGWAWSEDRLAGLQAALATATAMTLLLASQVAFWPRRGPLAKGNVAAAVILAVLAPAGAAGLAWIVCQSKGQGPQDLLPTITTPPWEMLPQFWLTNLREAFGVPGWLVGLALLWGWWRTVRRGWKRLREGATPVSWGLSVFLLVLLASTLPPLTTSVLPLLPWLILVLVFLVLDLIQGVGEQMVLKPPDSRAI